jgi:hypothetical protein
MNDDEMLHKAAEDWKPPVELLHSPPRESSLTAGGRALFVLAVSFFLGSLAAGAGLQALARRQAESASLLRERGVTIEAAVTRLWQAKGESRQYWVAYSFSAGGLVYRAQRKLPAAAWTRLGVGSRIGVVYVPSNPELNYPRGEVEKPIPAWLPYVISAALAVFGGLMLYAVRRERRLLEEGRAAPGVVTGHRRISGTHGSRGTELRYVFAILGGSPGKGRGRPRRNPPAVGSTICVLYDPDHPSSNAPYPLLLVRPRRD